MYSHKKVKHEDIRSKIHISNVPAVQHKACHGGQKGDARGHRDGLQVSKTQMTTGDKQERSLIDFKISFFCWDSLLGKKSDKL